MLRLIRPCAGFRLTSKFLSSSMNQTLKAQFRTSCVLEKEIEFKLADIGEGIAEVEIIEWFVKVGDKVEQFDKICEVQSDKATVEITSRFDGVITKVHHEQGALAPVGQALVSLETEDNNGGDAVVDEEEEAKEVKNTATPSLEINHLEAEVSLIRNEKPLTTPSVRRLSRDHKIDLRTVLGTGPQGRILKSDILTHIARMGESESVVAVLSPAAPVNVAAPTPTPAASPAAAPAVSAPPPVVVAGEDKVVPVSGMQRMMVKSMSEALKVPHFGYSDEMEMSSTMEMKKELSGTAERRGVKLSNMPFIMKAASLALLEYPILNSHVSPDLGSLTYKASHNMGIAMDTPRGLVVPVVKNVQALSLFGIAAELNRLQELGTAGRLSGEDLKGGTFSLSNIGAIGGTYAKPILVVPQVCIGALGRIQKLPRYDANDNIVPHRIMRVSWAADHRMIDGATMARFSNVMKGYLESPITMLAQMK